MAHERDFRAPFALRLSDGSMLSIDEVKRIKEEDYKAKGMDLPVKGGAIDGCICAECGEGLIAKLNSRFFIDFFSHAPGSNCKSNGMTAIHLMAQQILANTMTLWLPNLYAKHKGSRIKFRSEKLGKNFRFERSALEYRIEQKKNATSNPMLRIADVALFSGNTRVLVEICVTNPCTELKVQQYRDNNEPSIEIDLSNLPRGISKEALASALNNKVHNNKVRSRWLFHRAYEQRDKWSEAIEIDQYLEWVDLADELTAHYLNNEFDETTKKNIIEAESNAYIEDILRGKGLLLKEANDYLAKANREYKYSSTYLKRVVSCSVDSREPESRRDQAKIDVELYKKRKEHWLIQVKHWQKEAENRYEALQEERIRQNRLKKFANTTHIV